MATDPLLELDGPPTVAQGRIDVYALDRERGQLLRELTLLNRVSKSINQELEFEPLLDLVLQTVTQDFGYDGAAMLLLDAKREVLCFGRPTP